LILALAVSLAPQTVTVVENGGYFPVMIQLSDGRLASVLHGGDAHIGRAGRLDWIASSEDDRNPPSIG
jgi:hypothetical protein